MKKLSSIILISIILIISSCDILEKSPLDGPSDVNFPQNETELIIALNGVYNNLWFHSISATGQWEYVLDTTTDIAWDRNNSFFKATGNGSHSPGINDFATIWRHLYTGIARSNFILDNINRVEEGTSQELINQVDGQVRFLRAYWYSQLIMLWGDVPLITKTLGLAENRTPRTNKSEIVDFLLEDLDVAAQKLPQNWSGNDRGRATSGAAKALKARIALLNSRYDVAVSSAREVMDSNIYELYPNYRKLFMYEGQSNNEVIFEVMFAEGFREHRMPISVGSRAARANSTKVPTQAIVDAYESIDGMTIDESPLYDPTNPFENRDPRLKQSIAVPGDIFLGYLFESHRDSVVTWNYNVTPPVRVPNQDALNPFASFSGYLWKKMADPLDYPNRRNNSSLNFILIRHAEVLLTYAEAKIELNQIDQSVLDAINTVRGRESVQMPPIEPGMSQDEMRQIIRQERKVELAMEGFRLADIRRWGIAEEAMTGPLYGRPTLPFSYKDIEVPPTFSENGIPDYSAFAEKLRVIEQRSFNPNRDYLWPIPQSEMDVNNQLIQNPGY